MCSVWTCDDGGRGNLVDRAVLAVEDDRDAGEGEAVTEAACTAATSERAGGNGGGVDGIQSAVGAETCGFAGLVGESLVLQGRCSHSVQHDRAGIHHGKQWRWVEEQMLCVPSENSFFYASHQQLEVEEGDTEWLVCL